MDLLAKHLRDRARELGLSDVELARRAGLSQQRMSNYLNGLREPDLQTLLRLCDVLTTTPNRLLLGEGVEAEASEEVVLRDRIAAAAAAMGADTLRKAVAVMDALTKEEM